MKPGDVIDRYTVVEVLGQGGLATVYGVRHSTLATPHALKVLDLGGAVLRERLVKEGSVQATLTHPNIVGVTDILDVDGSPGLLMEFVAGPTLDVWLQNHQPSIDESMTLFRGILAAVNHGHIEGVVHRDLKPSNIVLSPGAYGAVTPKVLDFGLAKSFGQTLRAHATRSGHEVGTPAYMPPELIRDPNDADRRADIYALGCVLYELISGGPVFVETDRVELFKKIAAGEAEPLEDKVPEVPEHIAEAVDGMLCPDRRFRLPDCASVLEVLREQAKVEANTAITKLAEPRPLQALENTVLSGDSDGARIAAELAPPEMPALESFGPPKSYPLTDEEEQEPEVGEEESDLPPAPKPGRRMGMLIALGFVLVAIAAVGAGALAGGLVMAAWVVF